jgi:hypothetical protein
VTVVVPVYVFAPPNVNSPVPAFVRFPLPLTTPFQFTALATVTVEAAVSAPAPPNVNAPFNESVASPNVTFAPIENPFANVRAAVESLETTTPAVFNVKDPPPSPPSLPIRNVPAVTVTPPVNVFAPLNVSTEAPDFVNDTAPPPIAPLKTTTLGVVTVVFAVNVPAPLNVNAPMFVPSPNVTAPPIE